MAEITSRKFDAITKLEIVHFKDKFGAESILQHVLSRTRAQRAQDEADHLALLEANEVAFEQLQGNE